MLVVLQASMFFIAQNVSFSNKIHYLHLFYLQVLLKRHNSISNHFHLHFSPVFENGEHFFLLV